MLLWLLACEAQTDRHRDRDARRRKARALDSKLVTHQHCDLSKGNVVGCVCVDLEVAAFEDPMSNIDEFGRLQWSYYGRPLAAFAVHIRHAALVVGEVAASLHDEKGRIHHASDVGKWGQHNRHVAAFLSPECRAELLHSQFAVLGPAGGQISGDQIIRSFGLERDVGLALQVPAKTGIEILKEEAEINGQLKIKRRSITYCLRAFVFLICRFAIANQLPESVFSPVLAGPAVMLQIADCRRSRTELRIIKQ